MEATIISKVKRSSLCVLAAVCCLAIAWSPADAEGGGIRSEWLQLWSENPTELLANKTFRPVLRDLLVASGRGDLIRDLNRTPVEPDDCLIFEEFTRVEDAVNYASALLVGSDVVMINESHEDPRERIVLSLAVSQLSIKGFSRLALEALEKNPRRAGDGKLRRYGRYLDEPIFARAVRKAVASNMTLLYYDVGAGHIELEGEKDVLVSGLIGAREAAAADVLIKNLRQSGHGIIVFSGPDHILKTSKFFVDGEVRWLANLVQSAGYSVATVDQARYVGVNHQYSVCIPHKDNSYDATIILGHPKISARVVQMGFVEVSIPESLRISSRTQLFEAWPITDSSEQVPSDRLILFPGEQLSLALSPGIYRVEAWTPDGFAAAVLHVTRDPPN